MNMKLINSIAFALGLLLWAMAVASVGNAAEIQHDAGLNHASEIEAGGANPAAAPEGHHAIEALEAAIAAKHQALRSVNLSLSEREAVVLQLLALRDELITQHPKDVRRPQWLADQAADIYFHLLTLDAAGLVTHLGQPTAQQRKRAQQAASQMLDHAQKAEQAITRALRDLEATPDFSENLTLQLQHREMSQQLGDRQIPFVLSIAQYLQATFNIEDADQRQNLFQQASRTLLPLVGQLHPPLNHHAHLYAAFADAHLNRREAAHAAFTRLIHLDAVDPVLVFSAQIGAAMCTEQPLRELQRVAIEYGSADDLFFRLIIADAMFRLQKERSPQQALSAYTALLDEQQGISSHQLRSIVFDRLLLALDPSIPADTLPSIAQIARASRLASDRSTLDQGIDLLSNLLVDPSLSKDDRALALLTRAQAFQAAGRQLDAAEDYITHARHYPGSGDAEFAMQWGASLAYQAWQEQPRRAIPILHDALELLLDQYPNLQDIDSWRYIAGRVDLSESRFDEALDHFHAVSPYAQLAPDAAFMQARTLSLAAISAKDSKQQSELHQAALSALIDARQIIGSAFESTSEFQRAQQLRSYLASLLVIEADAHLVLGQPDKALALLRDLEDEAECHVTVIAQALQTRMTAYRALGKFDDALRQLDRFIAAAPDGVPAVLVPWLIATQRDVLKLLDDLDPDGAARLAQTQLEPLAARLHQWVTSVPGSEHEQTLLLHVADAYRLSSRFDRALALYEQLLKDEPDLAQLLFGKAECLFHLAQQADAPQRLGDAMLLYRRIIAVGLDIDRTMYWHAQLRSLQILDRIDRNTHQIVPQIQRLRLRDPELGGERLRRAFDALHEKYS